MSNARYAAAGGRVGVNKQADLFSMDKLHGQAKTTSWTFQRQECHSRVGDRQTGGQDKLGRLVFPRGLSVSRVWHSGLSGGDSGPVVRLTIAQFAGHKPGIVVVSCMGQVSYS